MNNVKPINDLIEHSDDSTCPCCPEVIIEPESGEMIVVHNALDGRE